MPIARFQMPDGRIARFEVPEGTTPEQAHQMMTEHFAQPPAQPAQAPQEKKSFMDTLLTNLGRIGAGATPEEVAQTGQQYKDLTAGAIAGAGDIGATIINPLDSEARKERKAKIEAGLSNMGAQPESSLYGTGKVGAQIAGTAGAGNLIAKPLMAAGGSVPMLGRIGQAVESAGFNVAPAANMAGKVGNAALRVGGGALTGGAAAGLIEPETAGAGAVMGGALGALSPVIGGAIEKVISKFNKPSKIELPTLTNLAADDAVKQVADDLGVKVTDIPDETVKLVRDEVAKAMQQGKTLDAAALLRQKEFEKMGIQPLQGQITRDPTQFAQERNLRGVSPEISGRLAEQNAALQKAFSRPAAGAGEEYQASNQLADALRKYQAGEKEAISNLYNQARAEGGRYANVDVPAFSQAANDALDSQMLGRFLPDQVKGLLNDISAGKLPLNVNNLVQVDSVLSQAQRNADAAGQKAIGVVRDALNNAPIESAAGETAKQAFDTARKAARANFAKQEAIPALKQIADGGEVTQDFVRKFVIQDKNPQNVKRLATLLQEQSPEAFDQAKSQIAADIKRAAFGENLDMNAAVSPERLAKKLRELGSEKMSAFFSPEEIANYQTASRVATYIEKHPNAAPVNTSNTLVATLMQNPALMLAGKGAAEALPGAGVAVAAGKAATGAIKNQMATTQAMNAKVPMKAMELTEGQRRLLAKALGGTSAGVSAQLAQ